MFNFEIFFSVFMAIWLSKIISAIIEWILSFAYDENGKKVSFEQFLRNIGRIE